MTAQQQNNCIFPRQTAKITHNMAKQMTDMLNSINKRLASSINQHIMSGKKWCTTVS